MREISLDTETTGLNPKKGDRVVEIGCVEMINHIATGEVFHVYVNPERDMPEGAFNVHGLSEEFLQDKPLFATIADDFLAFIDDAPLVIHNAAFDMGFLNWELQNIGKAELEMARSIDTVRMARNKFPGAQASLDALCRRFGIDHSDRTLHGALLDARLLADVYLELMGGRQTGLSLADGPQAQVHPQSEVKKQVRAPRTFAPSAQEQAAHGEFIATLKNPLWTR